MWFKFKNVATLIIETFHLLLITILLGNPFNVKQIDDIVVMASTATKTTLATFMANSDNGVRASAIVASLQQTSSSSLTPTPSTILSESVAATTSSSALSSLSMSASASTASSSSSQSSSLSASLFALEANTSMFARLTGGNGKFISLEVKEDGSK